MPPNIRQIQENTCVDIHISNRIIELKEAKALSDALSINTSVQSFELASNTLSLEVFTLLIDGLKKNGSIRSISIDNNKLGLNEVTLLVNLLNVNPFITSIHLSKNQMGAEEALIFSRVLQTNMSLIEINISNNDIGDLGVEALSKALMLNKTVQTLSLTHNNIHAAGAKSLGKMLLLNTAIQNLTLCYNAIGAEGMEALSQGLAINTTLKSLSIRDNNIGNEGVVFLSMALIRNKTLSFITLWNNNIGDEGIMALSEALKTNTGLTYIALWYNNFGDKGIKALSEMIKKNTTLQTLDIDHNKFSEEGIRAITDAMVKNFTLLKLEGVKVSIISDYLDGNKVIVNCLEVFKHFSEEPGIDIVTSTPEVSDGVSHWLAQLTVYIPLLAKEPAVIKDSHYLAEGYRLLTALSHLMNAEPLADIKALTCLLPPFSHPLLQNTADIALGRLLYCSSIKHYFQDSSGAERTLFYQAILQHLNNYLHKPDISQWAYNALFCITSPNKLDSPAVLSALQDEVALLSYNDILILIQQALVDCYLHEGHNPYETALLEDLWNQKEYQPAAVEYSCLSPAFYTCFNARYPGKKLACVDDYLLAKNPREDIFISFIHPLQTITETQYSEYKKMVVFDSQQRITIVNKQRELLNRIVLGKKTPVTASFSQSGFFGQKIINKNVCDDQNQQSTDDGYGFI